MFNIIRFYSLPLSYSQHITDWLLMPSVLLGQLIIPASMMALYAFSGSYDSRRAPGVSRLDIVANTFCVSFVGMLGIFFTALINDGVPERLANYELMLILLLCLFMPVVAVRLALVRITRRSLLSLPDWLGRAMIVNAKPGTEFHVRRMAAEAPDAGFKVVCVHSGTIHNSTDCFGGLPLVHGDIAALCHKHNITALMLPEADHSFLQSDDRLKELYRLEMPVFITPDIHSLLTMRPHMRAVKPEPLTDIASANISPLTRNTKRLIDIVVSAIMLIVLIPVYAILALLVHLDSPGPVLYRQERLGRLRKPFNIIKFRTMRTDAEDNGPSLSSDGDPRITRVGYWLRKYRLDELPQFWNVLTGQMSIVGPRPERAHFAEQILQREPSYAIIQQVRPGLTSWGMVKFGYASTVEQMVERLAYDMLYIQNISIVIDLKILMHTVATIVTGRGI